MMDSISKQQKIQQRIILIAGVEFLVATLCLVQINPINPLHNGLRILTMFVFGFTAAYGFRLLLTPGLVSSDDSVPVLRFPARQLVRIGVSLITLPAIFYVGYGESLIAIDSQYADAYVKRVLDFSAVKRRFEGEEAAMAFILRAAESQGKRAENLELTRQLVKPFTHYTAYIDLMRVHDDDPTFGMGIMARLYDKVGETAKAEQMYSENEYNFREKVKLGTGRFTLVLEARYMDLLRYIPEKEAVAKIPLMRKYISEKSASALKLGQYRLVMDLHRRMYDCMGIDGPIGYGDKHDFPVMNKVDVEWLLATIGKDKVQANLPELVSLCPEWKASDFVFEYGVIPPLPFGSQSLPDVFLNRNKENKAPLSWRVPPTLSGYLPEDQVIMPVSMCKKLFELAGDPDGYQHRIDDGHIYINRDRFTYEQAKHAESSLYSAVVRLKS